MTAELDHLLWATPDLERGMTRWAELTGSAAVPGGAHPGQGTCNAIVALQGGCYVEIFAPDPQQNLAGTVGAELAALGGELLWGFCCRTPDLGRIAQEARGLGLSVNGPLRGARTRPDGTTLQWSLLHLTGHRYGGLVPFFIDWQGSPHPSLTGTPQLSLTALTVTHGDPQLKDIYARLGIPVAVHSGPAGLHAVLRAPRGDVILTR